MSIQERNKNNAISRWEKVHNKEKKNIKDIKHLKARILGYLAGDGNISVRNINGKESYHTIRFYPDHFSLIIAFNEACKKVYNKEPIIKEKTNYYDVRIYSKPIVLDILNHAKFGIHSWEIPKSLLINKKCKKEWLRAFFDAEGYVGPKQIKVHSVNKKGLQQIQKLLEEFKIKSQMYTYEPKNPNYSTQYQISICKKEMRKKYSKQIGFNHEIKTNKLLNSLR